LPRGALREDYKIEVNSPTTQSYAASDYRGSISLVSKQFCSHQQKKL
jgi:hypothetical protein